MDAELDDSVVVTRVQDGTRRTRTAFNGVKVKIENVVQGSIRCPHPDCMAKNLGVYVNEKGCNVLTCTNHSPNFFYFCMYCKSECPGGEYSNCSCAKNKRIGTRQSVLKERNDENARNPICLDDTGEVDHEHQERKPHDANEQTGEDDQDQVVAGPVDTASVAGDAPSDEFSEIVGKKALDFLSKTCEESKRTSLPVEPVNCTFSEGTVDDTPGQALDHSQCDSGDESMMSWQAAADDSEVDVEDPRCEVFGKRFYDVNMHECRSTSESESIRDLRSTSEWESENEYVTGLLVVAFPMKFRCVLRS